MKILRALILATAAITGAALSGGCTTEGYCFDQCDGEGGGGAGAVGGVGGAAGSFGGDGGSGFDTDSGAGGGNCMPSNEGIEVCDGEDNDCDNLIDESPDIDFTDPRHCGSCELNCTLDLSRVTTPVCVPPPDDQLGQQVGTCDYDTCAPNFFDVDGSRENGCEYYCQWNPAGTNTTDPGGIQGCKIDDDCDGQIDEDVDTCGQLDNCGDCGNACVTPHATPVCVTTAAAGTACTPDNTTCQIQACDTGWVDVDKAPENGCEYECTPSNGGVEVCDGVDNDCDRKIDNADEDLSTGDPEVGDPCFGGTQGECIDPSHEGVKKCIAASIQCCDKDSNNVAATNPNFPQTGVQNGQCDGQVSPFVLKPGELPETCNLKDDDCIGGVDEQTIDSGAVCGSGTGECQAGTEQCINGVIDCIGDVGAGTELCNGRDDDCDGVIDGTKPTTIVACTTDADCATQSPNIACLPISSDPNNRACVKPPADVADASGRLVCDSRSPPPPGATSPCKSGLAACVGGQLRCEGSVVEQVNFDRCFEDTNCNGVLENQTGLTNDDPLNCGSCGNDCSALGANGAWICFNGVCQRNGCDPGFIECGGTNPDDCETACTATSSTELCDLQDNDCDCQVDEPPMNVPTPYQVCGVSPSATDQNCTDVPRACVNGAWQCTFLPDYCSSGTCSATADVCDGIDNDCDGIADETFKPPTRSQGFLGQACFSDDGLPAPGHGECRGTGIFVCSGDGTTTQCNASIDLTNASAEICNGEDDDCDGQIDEAADVTVNDSTIGVVCTGGSQGVCGDPINSGFTVCVNGAPVCSGPNVIFPGDLDELCNSLDDDCDGTPDNNLTDAGGVCGSGIGECTTGTMQCVSGVLDCIGESNPNPEVCDGLDNDCNNLIDDNPTDVGTVCDDPPDPPPGIPQPCQAGTLACIGSTRVCQGSILPGQTTDECFEDTNCDGQLTDQTGLINSDPANCGSCGNACSALDPNGVWACESGACVLKDCQNNHINCDGDTVDCELACTPTSNTEICNGLDDDCDCQVDEDLVIPTPVQVCGVKSNVSDPNCLDNVTVACVSGAWQCTFPSDYCIGGDCSTTPELCDGGDNDCDGSRDEDFKYPTLAQGFLGQACSSTGVGAVGPCQRTGSFKCDLSTKTSTICDATGDPTQISAELCDGKDNDCDGVIDSPLNDPTVGVACYGGSAGICDDLNHAGTMNCVNGSELCQGASLVRPGDVAETCDGLDNDCDGVADGTLPSSPVACTTDADCAAQGGYSKCLPLESDPAVLQCAAPPGDTGLPCGSGVGSCSTGTWQCLTGGTLDCIGETDAEPEACNGLDDDCDGTADNNLTDVGTACNQPPDPPAPTAQCPVVTSACQQGTYACVGNVLDCQGDIGPTATVDGCCEDSNCDGSLDNQPNFLTDVANCGGCGINCNVIHAGSHATWTCNNGTCAMVDCEANYIDCDGDPDNCERPCTYISGEACNGVDDDCNCAIDDAIAPLSPVQVCGVSSFASDPNCQEGDGNTGVLVQCLNGSWNCDFPNGYCDGGTPTTSCASTFDVCDDQDNNCNGNTDENSKPLLGTPCYSDDGLPPPGDGACQGVGVYVCDGVTATGTMCNAQKDLTKVADEACDGVDNDCDGAVDESYVAKGTDAARFVKPAVVQVSSNLWIYEYEASRPNATTGSPGTGNGYWTSGPTQSTPLDQTRACSEAGVIPWFNVTPMEVEQTCNAMGGFICPTPSWITACEVDSGTPCDWGYAGSLGTECTSPANYGGTPYCNLDGFDFIAGGVDDDGLLPTASNLLSGCYAELGAGIFDITGNLREITKRGTNDYPLMGGAFNTQSENGAMCDFDFYSVTSSFKFYDTGFRCCFSSDPTL